MSPTRRPKTISSKYTGKWVAFEKGQLIGAADTIAELRALMSDVGHRLIVRVGEVPPRRKYIGGSSIRRTESQHGTMLKTSSTTRLP